MKTDREPVLVWGQKNRQVVAIIRSLHAAGFFVIFAVTGPPGLAAKSRDVGQIWRHPPFEAQPDQFLAALDVLFSEHSDLRHIYPTDDREIDFLCRHQSDLPTDANVVMPAPAICVTCQDKAGMTEVIGDLGIPQAPYHVVRDLPELTAAIDDLGYPCILRPTQPGRRLLGRKAHVFHQASESAPFMAEWPRGHDALLIQEFVIGKRNDLCFIAESGDVLSAFQVRPLRTTMLDGTGLGSETVTVPLDEDLMQFTRRIARRFGYTGVGVCQYMVDSEARRFSFMELNPRLGGCTATLCGVIGFDYPPLVLDLSRGAPASGYALGFDYKVGVKTSSIHLDISSLLRSYRSKTIDAKEAAAWARKALSSFASADTDTTWSWRDPLPGIHGFLSPLRRRRGA